MSTTALTNEDWGIKMHWIDLTIVGVYMFIIVIIGFLPGIISYCVRRYKNRRSSTQDGSQQTIENINEFFLGSNNVSELLST